MGVAQYNRGTAVTRSQIDAELVEKRPAIERRMDRAALEDRLSTLEARNARLDADLGRAKRYLALARAERDTAREELHATAVSLERCKHERARWAKALLSMRRRWLKVSACVREHLTPAEWRQWADEHDKQ